MSARYIRKPKRYVRKLSTSARYPRAVRVARPLKGNYGMYGLPTEAYATLRYSDIKLYSPLGAGAAQGNIYSINDLRDPDVTGAGHQPMGFDQYMSQFRHFMVYAAKFTIHATTSMQLQPNYVLTVGTGTPANYTNPTQFAIMPQRDTTVNSNPSTIIESTPYVTAFHQQSPITCSTGWIDIARMAGKSRAALFLDQAWAGQAGVSPGQNMFCVAYQLASNNWDCQVSYNIQVIIEYKAKFWERATLPSS